MYRSVSTSELTRNVLVALFHSTSPCVCHGGVVVESFPRFPDEEEIGQMNLIGPGGSSGYFVDEDTSMFGPGRSSGFTSR